MSEQEERTEGDSDPTAAARWVVARARSRDGSGNPPPPPPQQTAISPHAAPIRPQPARRLFGDAPVDQVITAPAPWHQGERVFATHGRMGAIAGLAIKNALLNLCTLLLWRFWAKTRVRRYLWGQTTAWGDPLEYTGTGKELFVGFVLVVLAILLPLALLSAGATFFDAPWLAFIPQIAFAFLIPAASYRARRYMLSRTVWRGIRGGLTGSEWLYARKAMWAYALTALSLGWAYPWADVRLARFRWDHTSFGDRHFDCFATTRGLWFPFATFWLSLAAAGGVTAMAAMSKFTGGIAVMIVLAAGLSAMLGYAWYRSAFWNRMAETLHFAETQFRLDLRPVQVMGLMVTNWLITMLSLGMLRPVAALRTFRLATAALTTNGTPDFEFIHQGAEAGRQDAEGLLALADGMGDF